MDLQAELPKPFQRLEVYALDQVPQRPPHGFTVIAVPFNGVVEPLRQTGVGGGSPRVSRDLRWLLKTCELRFQFLATRRVLVRERLQVCDADHFIQAHLLAAFQLARDLGQLALDRRAAREDLAALGRGRLAVILYGLGNRLRRQQLGPDPFDHPMLDVLGGDDLAIAAGPALTVRAAGVLAAVQCHRRAAHGAAQQARQQALRLAGVRSGAAGELALTRLNRGPEFVVEDAQVRRGLPNPLLLIVQHRAAAPGVRMLAKPAAVEDPHSDIELLAQDPVLGATIAMECARRPGAASRPRHALLVERVRDRFRRGSCRIVTVDAADDLGLRLVDRKQTALLAGHDVVAVAATAPRVARLHPGNQAAACLLRELGEEELVHGAGETNVELGDASLRQRLERHATVVQPLEDVGRSLLVARQAIERFGEHYVELPGVGRPKQRLHASPVRQRGAGDAAVGERAHFLPASSLRNRP